MRVGKYGINFGEPVETMRSDCEFLKEGFLP